LDFCFNRSDQNRASFGVLDFWNLVDWRPVVASDWSCLCCGDLGSVDRATNVVFYSKSQKLREICDILERLDTKCDDLMKMEFVRRWRRSPQMGCGGGAIIKWVMADGRCGWLHF
jgi:hypothetical protein